MVADFQELFVYEESDAEDEALRMEGDLLDLEPVLRDAVVLSLPFQPLCRDDCPGLCVECGARLADDPDHQHDEAIDPRWAALQTLGEATDEEGGRTPALQRSEISGSPEAEDVAQQHASPSLAVEGCCALAGDLQQPRLRCEAPAPPRMP